MIRFFFCIVFLLQLIPSKAFADGFLRVDGRKIVNDQGELLLRGMGLGGWLLPEGYMLQTSGFANSPTEIRAKVVEVAGEDGADAFFAAWYQNYVTRQDIDALKAMGFNSIRLPLHYPLLTPKNQPGVWLESGFAQIDSCLAWCKANSMYLILDLHSAPGAQNPGPISDSDGEARLWQDAAHRERTVDIWKKLAQRYKDEPWVGGYDLLNEPAADLGPGNVPLRTLYIDITNAIRQIDTTHILFIEGNWYATDFSGLTPKWDDKIVYSFHKYWNDVTKGTIDYLIKISETQNAPLWCGESGENSNAWFTSVIGLFEKNNIGWSWWPHKKIGTISAPYSSPITTGWENLLKYWNGQSAKPSVTTAKTWLMQQADALKIENCLFRPDVPDAMFRQVQSPTRVPYAQITLPGKIHATDYDMGPYGVAWMDEVYQNISGGKSTNNGYQYRNDGVDIEICTDVSGGTNGFNVGWIEANDWMTYTINVPEAFTGPMTIRYASATGGGYLRIFLNGLSLVSPVTMPSTGGWQTWTTKSAGNVTIPAGTHELKLQSLIGGFNLNWVEWKKTMVSVGEDQELPGGIGLSPAWPNPFNPVTMCRVSLPVSERVQIDLVSVTGQVVRHLRDDRLPAGKTDVQVNADGLASGLYLIRLTAGSAVRTTRIVLQR